MRHHFSILKKQVHSKHDFLRMILFLLSFSRVCSFYSFEIIFGIVLIYLSLKKNKYIFEGIGGGQMAPLLNNQYYSLKDFKSIFACAVL